MEWEGWMLRACLEILAGGVGTQTLSGKAVFFECVTVGGAHVEQ